MKNEKASVSGETKGFNKNFDQCEFKPNHISRQFTLEFNEPQPKQPKSLGIVLCFDCRRQSELGGYRFALVPLCDCCRTKEDLRILNNRIKRRKKR